MSQNVTLSERDKLQIEKIKQMLLENKTHLDMSQALKIHRRTLYRKIQKWIKTEDFETWLKQAWLQKYQKVDDVEAFKGLTRLLGYVITRKLEVKEHVEQVIIDATDDEATILSKAVAILERKTKSRSIH